MGIVPRFKWDLSFAARTVVMLVVLIRHGCGTAQTVVATATPEADTFLSSTNPTYNYGAAGALTVSGSAATNGDGVQNGVFDSLIRFSTDSITPSLDITFGSHNWVVTGATLQVNENGAPNNLIFNRGVGAFEIRWIAADSWSEGTGTPMQPTMDGVVYQDLPTLLDASADETLGVFTNAGADVQETFSLALQPALLNCIRSNADVNLYLTAVSPSVGFTFNSRNYFSSLNWPVLSVTAVPGVIVPQISSIQASGNGAVSVAFDTVSNWNYVLQYAADLGNGTPVSWSNLLAWPAQSTNGQTIYVEPATNRQRFYRLFAQPD